MEKQREKRYLLILFSIAVFLLRVFYIGKLHGPIVYADEMGYWGHAANLTGHTWAGVMNGMPWYAFGYSLLLAPIFLVSADMTVMYRMAVLINAILGLISYWLAYKTVQKIRYDKADSSGSAVIAFAAVSYSAYIFHSHVAWSETLLSFFVWLILYELILLEESPSGRKGLLLGITVGAVYMVHSRMLAVIAAVLLTLSVLLWKKKIRTLHFLCVFGMIVAAFPVCAALKAFFVGLLNDNAVLQDMGFYIEFSRANTLSEQIAKLGQVFTADGFLKLMIGMAGQIWHLVSAAYLFAGFGVAFCIKKVCGAVKRQPSQIGAFCFPVASVLFTIPMTSLFFINYSYDTGGGSVRIDTLFYGRYIDIFMGILLLMALVWFCDQAQVSGCRKVILAVVLVYLTVSFVMYFSLREIEDFFLNIVDEAGIYIFHWLGGFSVWKCAVIALAGGAVCIACIIGKVPKKPGLYLACFLLVFLFSVTALKCMRFTIRGENDHTLLYTEMYDFLDENIEKKEPVFTLAGGKFAYDLQTRLVDKMVIDIEKEHMGLVQKDQYVVMPQQAYSAMDASGYMVCLQAEEYVVVQKE